ncbi:MAG TPA: WYL domain-containing protein [bacterium]|nr:WYL domain-containing protein [bacterium]
MSLATTQINRLIRILQILSTGKKITINELYDRFDRAVSKRTLQRDMLTLSNANIPVMSSKGEGNQNIWYVSSRFNSFIPIPLGMHEYLAANILKENLKIFRNTSFDDEVNSLIDKIEQIVPEDIYLELKKAKNGQLFEDYTSGEYDYSSFGDIINKIINAIIEKKKCILDYHVPHRENSRDYHCEPEKMIYYNGVLYVIMYIRKIDKFLLFAVQRIQNIKVLDEAFPDDHDFDETEFRSSRFGMYSDQPRNIKLRFDRQVRHYIEHRDWHHSQKMENDEQGNLIVSLHVGLTPELTSWILSWRYWVKVLQPQELIDKIKDDLHKMNTLYEK